MPPKAKPRTTTYWNIRVSVPRELYERIQPYHELGLLSYSKACQAGLEAALAVAKTEYARTRKGLELLEKMEQQGLVQITG